MTNNTATYRITISSIDEDDTLQRVDLLNSAMFRILKVARLCKVESADYRKGEICMIVYGSPRDPMMVPGRVDIKVEEA